MPNEKYEIGTKSASAENRTRVLSPPLSWHTHTGTRTLAYTQVDWKSARLWLEKDEEAHKCCSPKMNTHPLEIKELGGSKELGGENESKAN